MLVAQQAVVHSAQLGRQPNGTVSSFVFCETNKRKSKQKNVKNIQKQEKTKNKQKQKKTHTNKYKKKTTKNKKSTPSAAW